MPAETTQGDVAKLLRGAGLRPTRQRVALAHLLFASGDRHVTAETLHEEALARKVPVSLATVYNTLHQFTEVGLLRMIVVDPGRAYFDTNTTPHHHFFYEKSGKVEDIPEDDLIIAKMAVPSCGSPVRSVDVVVRIAQ